MPRLPARLGVWVCAALAPCGAAHAVPVAPSVETGQVPGSGDAADDIAIWIHPDNPALSLVIGTDKTSGMVTFNLDGSQRQFLGDGDMNNVDLRYNMLVGGQRIDIVAATNRVDDTIAGANQNFKLVRWESIALASPQPLVIDTLSWDPRAIAGDVNGDDRVDVVDVLLLLNGWGSCAQCSACPADLDGNCQVAVSDLLILLINWG